MPLKLLLLVTGLLVGLSGQVAQAQVAAPSQGGEVNLVLATATTMALSFGNTGNGQGRVVAMAATAGGMPVPLATVDGTFYSGNALYGRGQALGKGYVVYSGTGHSVTVTGLTPSTYYYITNSEYNTDGTQIAYNTRSSSMSTSTRAAAPASDPAPLPVELTSFTGALGPNNLATLHWTTATELNSDYFAIERSADGLAFAEVSRTAAGSSRQPLAYQWPDPQPLPARTYYRLRQADRDGSVHYSAVVALAPQPLLAERIDVYPSPSAGQATQLLLQGFAQEPLTLRVVDALGRLVMTNTLTPADAWYCTPLALPTTLSTGTYILTLAGHGAPVQKRFIISE